MRDFWYHFRKNRVAVLGAEILVLMTLLAIIGPFFLPYDPFAFVGLPMEPPSLQHPLGTDDLGRDVLARFILGTRVSMAVGFLAAATSILLGVSLGAVAGYAGGLIDQLLMRTAEFFQVLPQFFLAMVLVALFGASYAIIILVIGLLSWPSVARLTRSEFLSLRERDYVTAVRALGLSTWRVIFQEILPNAAPALIVSAAIQFSHAILLEAALSFIGLGDASYPSWGQMLNSAQQILRQAWWVAFFPGLGIFLTVAALNLLGDGLNDMQNPKLRAL
ncbi:ABC transporter permease [Propylenella binzhouense]|uniref:ABC transporter permease n=1 Tax=Propylenella binzhouense TaxID=2555902 RepID=A0A964T1M1_9HYPH|nr:ABC transporter permease [Propylenella binzhouense]MYZ46337.1 ABC transporter permease [Propylenella binzhouense]